MINYVKGDILEHATEGMLLHSGNARGIMNSGFAKSIREKYPEVYNVYKSDIDDGKKIGDISWVIHEDKLLIGTIIGQLFYGRDPDTRYVSYDALDRALNHAFKSAKIFGFLQVNMVKIGAGLGGGSWSIIEQIIINAATKNNFKTYNIFVYEL